MCGIMGYVGNRPAVDVLVKGLQRLEYRGYDSTGVAYQLDGKIDIVKSEGKLSNVEALLGKQAPKASGSHVGIGHTRWATHGKPTTINAHPHQTDHVVLVANGIIENYLQIREDIIRLGYKPKSDTDSELFGFLVLEQMKKGHNLAKAVQHSFKSIHGACSVVVISEREPDVIVGARNGSPMVVAIDPQGGVIFASDAQPLLEYTKDVFFMEHGDLVVGTKKGIQFFNVETGEEVKRSSETLNWSVEKLDKQGFAHYMLKEIHEQPVAIVDTMNAVLDRQISEPFHLLPTPAVKLLEQAKTITIVACGTSLHSAMLGKYWIEQLVGLPVHVDYASEFRYRNPVLTPGSLVIGISQSGETADTLAVIQEMKKKGFPTLAITNVRGSTISREANAAMFTSTGPEISVAATKTFTAQMQMLYLIAGYLSAFHKKQSPKELVHTFEEMIRLPLLLDAILVQDSVFSKAVNSSAKDLQRMKGFFFIGRGYSFPIALEGALKLKEIAYIHAEGYAAGELKHGPIAMIDEQMVVVVLAPNDYWRDKTVSNLEEVKARGAKILGVGYEKDERLKGLCDHWIPLPETNQALTPFLLASAVQLLSYELAVLRGTDVDKPRNLAKSVTVE